MLYEEFDVISKRVFVLLDEGRIDEPAELSPIQAVYYPEKVVYGTSDDIIRDLFCTTDLAVKCDRDRQ